VWYIRVCKRRRIDVWLCVYIMCVSQPVGTDPSYLSLAAFDLGAWGYLGKGWELVDMIKVYFSVAQSSLSLSIQQKLKGSLFKNRNLALR